VRQTSTNVVDGGGEANKHECCRRWRRGSGGDLLHGGGSYIKGIRALFMISSFSVSFSLGDRWLMVVAVVREEVWRFGWLRFGG